MIENTVPAKLNYILSVCTYCTNDWAYSYIYGYYNFRL